MVLHTVKRLVEQSVDVELHVAGAGPDAERLRSLARDLDISSAVFFHGAVQNMQRFYLRIDCLLHVPLTEAFGLVAIEAAAHGCPVVAAAVDGLPEAVAHGISGYCVTPTLPLSEYSNLGGLVSGVPEQVYDPAGDVMRVPRLVDPAALAAAVCRVLSEPRAFERMSRSASEHVLQSYDFDAHVDAVMGAITAFRSR
jgi:glycosyltransferase involved in cell wall biosynthesis